VAEWVTPNTVSNTTAAKSMSNIALADVAQAIGFALNPALGIANMVATEASENLL
jgi:hypothetical protein